MNDEKTYKPKNGDIITIPSTDGTFYARLNPETPLNNITFEWPKNPPRGSCVVVCSTQPISTISHDGAVFEPTFMTLPAGNISHVWCHLRQAYLITGQNQINPAPLSKWVRLKSFFQLIYSQRGHNGQ